MTQGFFTMKHVIRNSSTHENNRWRKSAGTASDQVLRVLPTSDGDGYSNSNHADCRMRQRGLRKSDFSLVREFGSVTNEGFILRRKDVEAAQCEMKRVISDLERLTGVAVITKDQTVVSCYRPTKLKRKRMLKEVNWT